MFFIYLMIYKMLKIELILLKQYTMVDKVMNFKVREKKT